MTDADHDSRQRAASARRASSLLVRAESFRNDAARADNSMESRFLLAYHASIQILSALLIESRAPSRSWRGTHLERIEAVRVLLPESADLLARIDTSRRSRNLLVYAGDAIETELLSAALDDLARLTEVALAYFRRARQSPNP